MLFEVTKEYLWDLFQLQHGCCALTGEKLILYSEDHDDKITASLDRIDPRLGYIEGNVQWTHVNINFMKLDLEQPEFVEWCCKVANYKRAADILAEGDK